MRAADEALRRGLLLSDEYDSVVGVSMAGYEDRPRTRAELDRRIEREFGFRQGYASVAAVMAAAVVARLLPSGAVKGGSALRLRYGDGATRFTDDVDVARTGTEGKYRDALALNFPRFR